MSPIGIGIKPEKWDYDQPIDSSTKSYDDKKDEKFADKSWDNNWNQFSIMRTMGSILSRRLMAGYVEKYLDTGSKEENIALTELLL